MKRRKFNAMMASLPLVPTGMNSLKTNNADPLSLWARLKRFPLYYWQKEILLAAVKPDARVAVSACCESGKTAVIAALLVAAYAEANQDAEVLIISPSERQYQWQFRPSLNTIGRGVPHAFGFTTLIPNGDYFDVDPTVKLFVVVDSAQSISNHELERIESFGPSAMVLLGSPRTKQDFLYEASSGVRRGWKGFNIPWTDCPHLLKGHTYKRKASFLARKGRNDPIVKNILYGEPA